MKKLITSILIFSVVFAGIGCSHSKTATKKLANSSIEEIITTQVNGEFQLDFENDVKLLNQKILQSKFKPQLLYKDSLDNFIISDVKYPDKDEEGYYDLYALSFCVVNEDTFASDGIRYSTFDLEKIMQTDIDDMLSGIYPVRKRVDSLNVTGRIEIPEAILLASVDIERNKGLNQKEWKLLFHIVSVYDSIMNESRANAALSWFKQPFIQLNKTDQEVLRRLYPKIIAINFNHSCDSAPQQPPLQTDTFDIELK